MNKAFILGSCRTPIGKIGGSLSTLSAVDLGSIVIKESIKRAGLKPEDVDHVIMGCVLQAGLGQNPARQAALKAGLPITTTAETVNCVCASGLDAVNRAAQLIMLGEADIVIAGGTESMSNAPFAIDKGRFGYKIGYPQKESQLKDLMVVDGLWDAFNDYHMGITAENVAEKFSITRESMDIFALDSQAKATNAKDKGYFDSEIVPIKIGIEEICSDEGIRSNLTLEKLQNLKPVFKDNGTVTAGNASGLNDGAAAVVVVSEKKLAELKLSAEAEWLGGDLSGVDPAYMGLGPVASTKNLIRKLNLKLEDIDLIEGNEAFAAQALAVINELQIDKEKYNINGGAIALGHPIGCSGCRILVTLIHSMNRTNSNLGLATLCVGGGMGCSAIIKKCED